jgi:DNA-binding winged helix-turn-helix (wHTH) protein
VRYRFGDFVLSPARRALASGDGRPVALIPRYFDLLVFLIEQRDRAVTKQEIFERVWVDVVVSDSALTQAIRSIRLALGDDPRESRFVRTVSRRGYQFIFAPVAEEDDAGLWPPSQADAGQGDVGRTPDVDPTSARRPPDVDPTSARRTPDVDPAYAGRTPDVRATDEMAVATGAAALSAAVVGALAGVGGGLAILALPGSQADSHV